MDRLDLLRAVADRIVQKIRSGHPLRIGLRIGIDGRCAAGKTTLADELAALLRSDGHTVVRLSGDNYHHPPEHRYRQGEFSSIGYYEDAFDIPAIQSAVAEAALSGALVILDGLFLFRRELDGCWDYRIFVDVDTATSLSRTITRDTGILGPRDLVERKHVDRYEPAFLIYTAQTNPEAKADLIIDNREIMRPVLTL